MDILDVNSMLTELKKLRREPECGFCNEKCKNPVKVRVCGHYFCKSCLEFNKDMFICPKCKICYEKQDVDYHNIAKETEQLLTGLEKYFLSIINASKTNTEEKSSLAENVSIKIQEKSEGNLEQRTIKYNDKRYQIIFINEHCKKINAKGETPLHIACKRNKLEDVTELLKRGVDINVQDFAGWAPLHEAVESGSEEIVEILLENGALIDILGEEYTTPLHKATVSQKSKLIKLLLKYGADKEAIDIFGKKPIDYAKTETLQNILMEWYNPIERTEMLCCNKKIIVYCYYIEQDFRDKLKNRKIKILQEYDSKKVTHFLIRRTHKISTKILVSMLDGCIILPQEWIDSFLNNDLFIPIPDYTFINNVRLNKGIQKAMMNHLLKCPKLFSGINFFISGHKSFVKIHDIKFTKVHIASLITAGGGKLLHRAPALRTCDEIVNFPYHARNSAAKCCNYIIYEENNPPDLRYQMPEIKHKSSNWLVECVIDFKILD